VLTAAEEPELRELVELIASARHGGRVAWSLGRFEMGCERSTDPEALSDNLLAIRSLLDADDDAGRASLAQRLAALCSEEPQRAATRARLEAAFALERRLMAGAAVDPDLDEGEDATPRALCGEIEHHVRALLRDVVCGYLDPDLRSVADDILLASAEPIDIQARDTRDEELEHDHEAQRAPGPDADPESEPDHPAVNATTRAPDGPGTAADPRSSAWAVAALAGPRTYREAPPPLVEDRVDVEVEDERTIADQPLPVEEPPPEEPTGEEPVQQELDAGVTPSADWELDDDPASYSAPI